MRDPPMQKLSKGVPEDGRNETFTLLLTPECYQHAKNKLKFHQQEIRDNLKVN